MPRKIVWFSCGAASAIATKFAADLYGDDLHIVYCDTGGEHPDNKRFLLDVQKWVNREIIILKDNRYVNHFDVFMQVRYIKDQFGAPCTRILKRMQREKYQLPDDVHIFGFTAEETERAEKIDKQQLKTHHILIERGITKEMCLGFLWKAGIKLPVMYELGYEHNNCIACCKGGMGYFNKIRKDFPEHFNKMAMIEREICFSVLKDEKGMVFLDELEPTRGNFAEEKAISCDILCQIAYNSNFK
jgi:3'-phosphoadenosine 5'-phosphosulfate sulfotransferase (PAPS reductase)/FAD synthetase